MPDDVPDSQRQTVKATGPPGAPSPGDLARLFPQLEILELIGRGGMGYVYKARQPALDRLVALKLLPAELAGESGFADRFAREARALARLSHPAIVAVHDSGQAGGQYYFVMEYVDGVNLRQALRSGEGRLPPAEAMRIVTAVCDALDYAHHEGVVHRDIKPENILLDARGRVKIADFGLAKLLAANGDAPGSLTLTAPRQMMGTPHYMAPEQTERPLEVDHRADIYALGVVFYEMLTGELPLGRFPLPSELGRGDRALDEIVARALQKDPSRRFQRASEIGTAVASALSGRAAAGAGTASGSRLWGPGDPPPAADRVLVPALVMILAGILALATFGPWLLVRLAGLAIDYRATEIPGLIAPVLGAAAGWVMLLGAVRMRRLESRALALAAAVAALGPYHVCWLPVGLPVGIWALVVLARRDVAEAFRAAAAARAGAGAA